MVCEMVHSQYNDDVCEKFNSKNFYATAAEMCWKFRPADMGSPSKVLEIGCLGGRICFDLAQHFDEVVGVDFTANLIRVGHTYVRTFVVLY